MKKDVDIENTKANISDLEKQLSEVKSKINANTRLDVKKPEVDALKELKFKRQNLHRS